nr:NADH dehydrogenase subunit 2 [Pingus sinensis]
MLLFVLIVGGFFLINMLSGNVLVWWSIFLLMTMVFLFLGKFLGSFLGLINYFLIQESMGLLFLFVSFSILQFLVLMMKVGVSPLHFWVLGVTSGLLDFGVAWFLTLQKLPFIPVFLQIFHFFCIWLFLFGILVCHFQLFSCKSFSSMVVLSSIESFNWLMLFCFVGFFSVWVMLLYYFLLIFLLLPGFNSKDFCYLDWLVVLIFLNIPLGFTFFVKFFSLGAFCLEVGVFLMFVLFCMVLSVFSFGYWLVIMSSYWKMEFLEGVVFVVTPLIFLVLV